MTEVTWSFGWRVYGSVSRALGDGGRVAAVAGPVACGKSRLLDMIARFAEADDIVVARARCSLADRMTPMSVLSQLLSGSSVLTGADVPGIGDPAGLVRALTGGERPALVVVDDLRYADDASARFVVDLAAGIGEEPLLLLLADRLPDVCEHIELVKDPAARSRSHQVRLTALSPMETRQLAEEELGAGVRAELAEEIHALAHGNPLLVRAVLEDMAAAGWPDCAVVGSAYRRVALEVLRAVTPEARMIAAAVLADGRGPAALAARSGLDRATAATALAELELSGMLDGDRLTPAAEQAMRADLPKVWPLPYPYAGSPHTAWRAVPMVLAGAPLTVPMPSCEAVDGAAEPGSASGHEETAAPGAGYTGQDDVRAAVTALERHIADEGSPDRAADLAGVQLLIACEYPDLLCDLLRHRPLTGRPQVPRYRAAAALAGTFKPTAFDGDPAASADEALKHCARTEEAMPTLVAALVALMHRQQCKWARTWCDQLLAEGRDRSEAWRAHLHTVRAEARLRLGDRAGARDDVDSALDLLHIGRWGVRVGWPVAIVVMLDSLAGDLDAAARALSTPMPPLMNQTWYGIAYRYVRGHYYLAIGDHGQALADFLSCGRVTRRWGVDLTLQYPWQAAAAATYHAMGDYTQTIVLIEEYRRSLTLHGRKTVDRETAFDLLSHTTDALTLTRAIEAIQGRAPIRFLAAGVPRYKIHDRYSRYLAKLSRSEQRVAVLAAKGLTNRCIANELSLTVSTIEQHLTRIYRKLDVGGRNGLRAALG
ncbi:hypothetical protein CTZ27_09845 [Streptomyces griseocarneus]|nr:hypothetical protein CTZ27_09845 [Streptomyces griseocarneus]